MCVCVLWKFVMFNEDYFYAKCATSSAQLGKLSFKFLKSILNHTLCILMLN